jgi:CheY-like chemotaxis protein
MKPDASAPVGLLLCNDLLFSSRITGVARDLGLAIRIARTPEQLAELARTQPPACVVIDLAHPGLDIATLVQQLRPQGTAPWLVSYGSHVDAQTLHQARAAGCDVVLPRSKFVEDLPAALPRWFAGHG